MSDLITGEVTRLEYLGIESLEDAVIEMQKLEAGVLDSFSNIRQQQKAIVRKRFKQGQIIHLLTEDASYGDGAVKRLSQGTGISESTLYECRSFYLLPEFSRSLTALESWLENTEEKKGSVNWSYCRSLAQKRLDPTDPAKAEIQKEKQKRNLEKRAERLEQDAEDYIERSQGEDEEIIGVAAKAKEVAEDTRRQIETRADPKPVRVVDDEFRVFVKSHRCAVCDGFPTDPAHLPVKGLGGMGTKVWDYLCVPLCREHHDEFDQRRSTFYQRYDVNLFQVACLLLIEFFTGIRTTEN